MSYYDCFYFFQEGILRRTIENDVRPENPHLKYGYTHGPHLLIE
jgi:hypothetical protein